MWINWYHFINMYSVRCSLEVVHHWCDVMNEKESQQKMTIHRLVCVHHLKIKTHTKNSNSKTKKKLKGKNTVRNLINRSTKWTNEKKRRWQLRQMRLSMTIICSYSEYVYKFYSYVVRGAFSSPCFWIHCKVEMLLSGPIHALNTYIYSVEKSFECLTIRFVNDGCESRSLF